MYGLSSDFRVQTTIPWLTSIEDTAAEIADAVEKEVRENLYKLMGGPARPQAKPAEKAVAVNADDFNDED